MKTSKTGSLVALTCSLALWAAPAVLAGHDADSKFKKMDADGDGKIARAEHAAAAKQMFTECDANRDGSVTATEMNAATAGHSEKPSKHDKTSAEKIKVIDQDGDGKLTALEHETGSEIMFAKMDKDVDGFLSKAEWNEGHKELKKDK